MKTLNIDKTKSYILACSYGPDSMFLFDLLLKNNINFVVAHVNYGYRVEAKEETLNLEKYCLKNNIQMFSKFVSYSSEDKNFENWAREIRYNFFSEVASKTNIFNVLIAHNEDDLIETYLMQKRRNNVVSYYGLNSEFNRLNYVVYRPILNFSKQEIMEYLEENNIPFALDKTNFDKSYQRNKLRYDVVFNLSNEERKDILLKIKQDNGVLQGFYSKLQGFSTFIIGLKLDQIKEMDADIFQIYLFREYKNLGIIKNISKDFAIELRENLLNHTGIWTYKINEKYTLVKDYNLVHVVEEKDYSYRVDFSNNNPKNIKINFDSSKKDILSRGKYIKNIEANEILVGSRQNKKVSRIFIDYKMPYLVRKIWPGIYDSENNLIYTPRYREEYKITEDSILIFKIEDLLA